MATRKRRMRRIDGVEQAYHVGSDTLPRRESVTRYEPRQSVTGDDLEDRVVRGRAATISDASAERTRDGAACNGINAHPAGSAVHAGEGPGKPGSPVHRIAWAPEPDGSWIVSAYSDDGREIGYLIVSPLEMNGGFGVDDITVEPNYRRQGVGRQLWATAHECGLRPHHSTWRTREGDAFAHAMGGDIPPNIYGEWDDDTPD